MKNIKNTLIQSFCGNMRDPIYVRLKTLISQQILSRVSAVIQDGVERDRFIWIKVGMRDKFYVEQCKQDEEPLRKAATGLQ